MSDDTVGYQKPPVRHRFRKGQSGNPKGRPKGAKGLNTVLQKIFEKSVTVKEGGVPKKIPIAEAVGMRLVEKALQGDPRAMKEFMTLHQKYDDAKLVVNQNTMQITYVWASPFDPETEPLDYLTEDERTFLRYIMRKREQHQHPDRDVDTRSPFLLVPNQNGPKPTTDIQYLLENI